MNLKTPDEIKKGLELCSVGFYENICTDCPYSSLAMDECPTKLKADALAYIQQLEAERDAAVKCIGKLAVILKTYPYAATNCCAYEAYKEIKKYIETVRGVQKEE
jgi:hypothetical protein